MAREESNRYRHHASMQYNYFVSQFLLIFEPRTARPVHPEVATNQRKNSSVAQQ